MVFASRHILEDATLVTESAGSYDTTGVFVPGAEVETAIEVVTAAPSGSDASDYRDVLMEGSRLSDARWFFLQHSIAPLRAGDGVMTDGDIIRYEGDDYRISLVQDWTPAGYRRALGIRIEGQ